MSITVARGARAWLTRRAAPLLLVVTTAGLAAGCAAWLAGDRQAADLVWLADRTHVGQYRNRVLGIPSSE